MVSHLKLARPYAKALFMEAKENDQLTSWLVILNVLAKIIENRSIGSVIDNPNVSDEEIKDVFLKLLHEIEPKTIHIVKEKLRNFLQLLIDGKRLVALPDIALFYSKILNDYKGITEAEVISAFLLSNNQRKQIKKKLEKRFNAKVKLKITTDKSLVGGAIVRVDNWVIDGSIKGKLARLMENLKR